MAFLTRHFYLVIIAFFFAALPARADDLQLAEQEIKAGLLYNFLKYTDWPPERLGNAASPIGVCMFGDDPFYSYLQPMAGRTVNQRNITLRKLHDIHDAGSCHLLFVASGDKNRWPQFRDFLKGKSVLTVSDFAGFADSGGMIEFGRRDNHISVDLNIDAVRSDGLRVQDRLLRLVTVVHPAGG